MKIKDAVFTAATFLQLDDLTNGMEAEGFDAAQPQNTLSESDAHELVLLVRCCNLIIGELSNTAFPLKKKATVTSENGKLAFAALDDDVLDIYAVEQNGVRLPFDRFYDGLLVPVCGKCTITYSFAPAFCALADDSPFAGNKPSARLLAYGVAREYCLISGRTDDAAMWDGRFLAGIEEESRKKGEATILPRKWR